MFARSTSLRGNPSAIDAGIAHVRNEVLPTVTGMDGCVGLSMMADRESGRCIVTTSWQSEQDMLASADRIVGVRQRAAEILGGTPQVDHWEIAVMHRDHPTHDSACIRSAWLEIEPGMIDGLVDAFRLTALPQIEAIPGFCSASFLIDRAGGRAVSSACFESRATLDAGRDEATRIRSGGTRQAGATVVDVAEFELVIAHLRVPESV